MFVAKIKCIRCEEEYPQEIVYKCGLCGGIMDIQYDYDLLMEKVDVTAILKRREFFVWKYKELLPISDYSKIVTLREGGTPFFRCNKLSEHLGIRNLYAKDETRNPTGSFKDRSMTVAVSKAMELGVKTVVTASTGNAGAALSAYAANAGLNCVVFIPQKTPITKMSQTIAYGAKVVAITGSYSDAFGQAKLASQKHGWFNATSTFLNPYATEGDKTLAYEIYEQFKGRCPDWILIPVGAGPLLVGVYKGFTELKRLDLLNRLPRMIGVQAEGCAPIAKAFEEGKSEVSPWESPDTIASGIADPLQGYAEDGTLTLQTIRKSGGYAIACSDDEIREATAQLAKIEGILAEPAGATSVAGLMRLVDEGVIDRKDVVACVVTGTGLKEAAAILEYCKTRPPLVDPGIEELQKIVD